MRRKLRPPSKLTKQQVRHHKSPIQYLSSATIAFCLGRSPCETGSRIQVGWSEPCALVGIRRGTRGGAQQRTRGERSQRKPRASALLLEWRLHDTVKSGVRILGGDQGV